MKTQMEEFYPCPFWLPPYWKEIIILLAIYTGFACARAAHGAPPVQKIPWFSPDKHAHIQLNTEPGIGYVVEASSDLRDWAELFKSVADGSSLWAEDATAKLHDRRFYRVWTIDRPDNDDFEHARELAGSEAEDLGCNINATRQEGEPVFAPYEGGGNSIWWRWKAPSSGPVYLSTAGSMFQTLLAVFTGDTLTNLVPAAQDVFASRSARFAAREGTTYYIGVAGSSDDYGMVRLFLTQESFPISDPPPLAGETIILKDAQFPNQDTTELSFSDDGTSWVQTIRNSTRAVGAGTVLSSTNSGETITAILAQPTDDGHTNVLTFSFAFRNETKGIYSEALNGQPWHGGKFSNFRQARKGLAFASLEGLNLIGKRTWTTTGLWGQSHHYTFAPNHTYHDSDKPEEACGRWSYVPDGDKARLILDYAGPADFVGDHHEIEMTFTNKVSGSFTSRYSKNDGTLILIDGQFTLEDE